MLPDPSTVMPYVDEGTLGLAYTSLIPVLIRSIQEQQEQIERLEGRLVQLESRTPGD
jgi:hypothetical protein